MLKIIAILVLRVFNGSESQLNLLLERCCLGKAHPLLTLQLWSTATTITSQNLIQPLNSNMCSIHPLASTIDTATRESSAGTVVNGTVGVGRAYLCPTNMVQSDITVSRIAELQRNRWRRMVSRPACAPSMKSPRWVTRGRKMRIFYAIWGVGLVGACVKRSMLIRDVRCTWIHPQGISSNVYSDENETLIEFSRYRISRIHIVFVIASSEKYVTLPFEENG